VLAIRPFVSHHVVMRTAIYSRVSRDDQQIENQMIVLRTFCRAAGHEVVVEYIDDGITGSGRKRRPAFERMMDGARQRRFDLLLFWSLDRLSREGALATLQHLSKLDSWGVAWRSHTEAFLDSTGPLKDAVVAIFGCVAKMERTRISDRTKAGLARTKARGTVLGRRRNVQAHLQALALHRAEPTLSARAIARRTGISLGTVQRALVTK
jgi:DNA invertase Pin-like site-specific DNA recombinase